MLRKVISVLCSAAGQDVTIPLSMALISRCTYAARGNLDNENLQRLAKHT